MRRRIRTLLIAVVLGTAMFLTPAWPGAAAGPLANCQSGQPFLWPNGGASIPFNPDQGSLGPLNHAQAVTEVQAAFDTWANVPSSTASYVNAGELPVDVNITNFGPFLDAPAPDGLSAIVFDHTGQIFDLLFGPGSGILGFAGPEWGNPANCQILEGLSFLNGPAFTNATAARDVMVHEFGHYTNLAHSVVNGQIFLRSDSSGPTPFNTFGPIPALSDDMIETMYPFYFGPGSGTQTLEADDIAALSTLYPALDFFSTTGTISGEIFAPNKTTKLTGVNVIARNIANPFDDAVSAISSDFTDDFAQSNPFTGRYRINGLTPGAQYAVFVDGILAGGFSTPPLLPLPGPEEFYNGAAESNTGATDDPSVFTPVTASAGSPVSGINIIFNGLQPGPIPLGDDTSAEIFLPFDYTLCDQTFSSVFVNSNGNLTFGSGDTDLSESAVELLADQPRIAALWDDLNPARGGTVSFSQSANTFNVRFENVPEFPNTGANTFEISLKRSSNHTDMVHGNITAVDGLAGVSCGGAITSGFETASDLSSFAPSRINLHNQPATYEQFGSGNPNDLGDSTVLLNGTTNYEDSWAGPNDTLAKARRINLPFDTIPAVRFTEIDPTGGDVDYYRFEASAGASLVAEIIGGQLDSMIGLFDEAGNLLALDDDSGTGLLSRIVFPIPADGEYVLAVTAFPDSNFDGDGGSGGRYVLDVFTTGGRVLALGDDDFEALPLGFAFPFQGQNRTSVFVNSNGNLTFGAGDTDFSESVAELLAKQLRIVALWDDLSPNNGGVVIAEGDSSSMTVRFVRVPEFPATGSNTFAVTMRSDGSVEIVYGTVTALDGLVGVTPGGGAANPGETDLSAATSLSVVGTTYELFTASDPFDLDERTLSFQA